MTTIKTIRASIVCDYDPEEYGYYDFCKESELEPTQKGFLEYIRNYIIEDVGFEASIETL